MPRLSKHERDLRLGDGKAQPLSYSGKACQIGVMIGWSATDPSKAKIPRIDLNRQK
jgi:hypothetical protein